MKVILFVLIVSVSFTLSYAGLGSFFSRLWDYHQGKCLPEDLKENFYGLKYDLKTNVFGQELALKYIYAAVKSHFDIKPDKALVLTFHGPPGTGKNHISSIIANNLFKGGLSSNFVHLFNSLQDFTNPGLVGYYQSKLKEWIIGNATLCPRSMFIFDEVEKYHPGVLDVIKPFMDHNAVTRQANFKECIFILISNAGQKAITQTLVNLIQTGVYQVGTSRSHLNLFDFEKVLRLEVYNQEGGLKHSELIDTYLVDHFIPFLPLEATHIGKCIRKALAERHRNSHVEVDEVDVMRYVTQSLTFMPPPADKFITSGCKQVNSKVYIYFETHNNDHWEL